MTMAKKESKEFLASAPEETTMQGAEEFKREAKAGLSSSSSSVPVPRISEASIPGCVDVDVPSDNRCWFWSVGLSWLLQAMAEAKAANQKAAKPPHTYPAAFANAYGQLFGVTGQVNFRPIVRESAEAKGEKWEINDPNTIEAAYQMLLTYDGKKDTPNRFEGGILSQLICEVFRANLVRFMRSEPADAKRNACLQQARASYTGREGGWDKHLTDISRPDAWGGTAESAAVACMLNTEIHVYHERADRSGADEKEIYRPDRTDRGPLKAINIIHAYGSALSEQRGHYRMAPRQQHVYWSLPLPISKATSDVPLSSKEYRTAREAKGEDLVKYADAIASGIKRLKEVGLLTDENQAILKTYAPYAQSIQGALYFLNKANLVSQENFVRLTQNAQHAEMISRGLSILMRAKLANQENFIHLTAQASYSGLIGTGLEYLIEAGFASQENFNLLIQHAQDSSSVGHAILYLKRAGVASSDNLALLFHHAQHAGWISQGLEQLRNAGLVSQEHFMLLTQCPSKAETIARIFVKLRDAGLLSETNKTLVVNHGQYAQAISGGLGWLGDARLRDPKLANQEYFTLLIQHAQYADQLGLGFFHLHNAEILTDENRAFLIAHAEEASSIGQLLGNLKRLKLLTTENRTLLDTHLEWIANISFGLQGLIQGGLANQDNFTHLIQHAKDAGAIGNALQYLQMAGLASQESFSALIQQAYYSNYIISPLNHLRDEGLATQANFISLLRYPEFLEEITEGNIIFSPTNQTDFDTAINGFEKMRRQREVTIMDLCTQGFFSPGQPSIRPLMPDVDATSLLLSYLK